MEELEIMTWFLILFSFLPAGDGLDKPTTVREQLGPFATYEACFTSKGEAMREAKRMQQKQIGASCVQTNGGVHEENR